jgi:cathepsin A (carboxypeptidase C)
MIKSFNVGILAALGFAQAAVLEDKVTALPNCPELTTDTYAGYLEVSGTKKLHYYYTESLRSPRNDPVLLWSNGGPGCSSLLGAFQENGPYTIDNVHETCVHNPYSWNHNANMLYIEAPAGVGYSIGSGAEDQAQNDMSQSDDLFKALEQFFMLYPERLPNDLFLSGESYAGIYIPYLAW